MSYFTPRWLSKKLHSLPSSIRRIQPRGHSSADPRLWVAVRAELLVYGACIRRDAGALGGHDGLH